jgi:hypothetical protein
MTRGGAPVSEVRKIAAILVADVVGYLSKLTGGADCQVIHWAAATSQLMQT